MNIELVLLILANVANVIIGLFALSKDWRNLSNRLFALLTISLVGWPVLNYLSISSNDPEIIFAAIKGILFFVVLQNALFMLFVFFFRSQKMYMPTKIMAAYLFLTLLTLAAGLSVGFFSGYQPDGASIMLNPGPAIGLFLLHTVISIGLGMTRLSLEFYRAKSNLKEQYRYLLLAGVVLFVISPFTNFVMPIVLNNQLFLPLAPLYTLIFACLIAYAMLKHHFLDIRLIVARSVAYLLLVAFLSLVYFSVLYGLTSLFFLKDTEFIEQSAPLISALFLVGTAPMIKPIFDRLTNKIFFRDAYDPQAFLDKLNATMVTSVEMGILLRHTAMVIEEGLKAPCCIYLKGTSTTDERLIGSQIQTHSLNNFDHIESELKTISDKTVVTENLGEHYSQLRQELEVNNIAAITTLASRYTLGQQSTAYILLAPKKSGNAYSKQDIKIIDIAADELLIAIQNALRFEEIQNFNVTLQQRINQATDKLKKTNAKLKELDQNKDEFISMASHQLRTPLTAVKGYLSMVLDGDAGKTTTTQKELLSQAYMSSQRMVYLIADLLNVSRLKTGKFHIEQSVTSLVEIVESELDQLNQAAKNRKLTLLFNKPDKFPELFLDETKTRQVIMNFIDNAIHYTPKNGRIKIDLRVDKKHVYFTVTDNGIGIPKEDQRELFTKFFRAKNAQKVRPDGTGLGLFMAKKVISQQGGQILFHSTEGKGSTFGFMFEIKKHKVSK